MYAKIFTTLWVGSLYGKTEAQLVFIYLCVHADSEAFVRAVPEAISGATGIPVERVITAIELLEAPDPDSNSLELDGRRLEKIASHSWHVVNLHKYMSIKNMEDRKRQNREAQARRRYNASASVSNGQHASASVIDCNPMSALSAHRDVDVDLDVNKVLEPNSLGHEDAEDLPPALWFERCFWPEYPKKVKKPEALRAMVALFKKTPAAKHDELGDAILDGLERYKRDIDGKEREFISHPGVWIRNRRWEDEHGPAT